MRTRKVAAGAAGALALAIAGCGSGASHTTATTPPEAHVQALASGTPASCQATVLEALTSGVLERVYREGASSERTVVARRVLASPALRAAIESVQAAAVQQTARQLLAHGHISSLQITAAGRTLASVGGPALAPLRGAIDGASGAPIAAYTASVLSDESFLIEGRGITGGLLSIRAGDRSVGGSARLPGHAMQPQGTITLPGGVYQYDSFAAETYPSGAARIYLLRPIAATTALCGASTADTVVNAVRRVARLIYLAELGPRALAQVERVEGDPALLRAVARREPAAVREAVRSLLNQHIVRLRVLSRHRLLADVGGPFVLAPVPGSLRLRGHQIGRFVLSVQDDEGYRRLVERLAGLRVLMYMQGHLVKNSLGPEPGNLPATGPYEYRGRTYRVFTLHLGAFPTGPLLVRVLVPIPYP